MVFRALCGTSGRTWCATSPRVGEAGFGGGGIGTEAGAGFGAAGLAVVKLEGGLEGAGLEVVGLELAGSAGAGAGAASSIFTGPSWLDGFRGKIVR